MKKRQTIKIIRKQYKEVEKLESIEMRDGPKSGFWKRSKGFDKTLFEKIKHENANSKVLEMLRDLSETTEKMNALSKKYDGQLLQLERRLRKEHKEDFYLIEE